MKQFTIYFRTPAFTGNSMVEYMIDDLNDVPGLRCTFISKNFFTRSRKYKLEGPSGVVWDFLNILMRRDVRLKISSTFNV